MNKAEAKRYVEGNITIIFMIISSSPSYIYILQVLHSSRVFLLLNAAEIHIDTWVSEIFGFYKLVS